ncbi:polyprenol monophosphomannose synthase [Mycetocola reblochoni]|uniref:Dolichol-phosphate mannosyltransferase in lipid-linked oligosaccharide synthesis cluster n=2 Tax=Mycetocola reblochoni TaxID=331618 RepID=A0A1R4K0D1_9MICO|nr:polyprenol monophosphomannose synthase [Mycetocola reblochoni]RLP70480.1 polyprenol monophosphomannose synthase [Mycetocola reblochoni]SJN37777.1 Dolichol-phosphate mannosyltransferase in lipid-linked oligosaccharide synthesis cluster [Mycetocola reblochoni REB411]
MPDPGRALVIVPCYNEVENIPLVLERILSTLDDVDVLVVDDNSPDGTGELADRIAAEEPRVTVMHRSGKLGLGTAYLQGFSWGLSAGYRYLVEMDADGSHPADQLPAMLRLAAEGARDGVGLVIGSRWVPGGGIEDWPRRRQLLSRGGNWYVRAALGIDVKDATAGYRVYTAEALRAIDFDEVHAHGYIFQVGMTLETLDAGYRVVEHPIVFRERQLGHSKMSTAIVAEAMVRVTGWGLVRRLGRRGARR